MYVYHLITCLLWKHWHIVLALLLARVYAIWGCSKRILALSLTMYFVSSSTILTQKTTSNVRIKGWVHCCRLHSSEGNVNGRWWFVLALVSSINTIGLNEVLEVTPIGKGCLLLSSSLDAAVWVCYLVFVSQDFCTWCYFTLPVLCLTITIQFFSSARYASSHVTTCLLGHETWIKKCPNERVSLARDRR